MKKNKFVLSLGSTYFWPFLKRGTVLIGQLLLTGLIDLVLTVSSGFNSL